MDVFRLVIVAVQKMQLREQRAMGTTIIASLGSLFTKGGADKLSKAMDDAMDSLDNTLYEGTPPDERQMVPATSHRPRPQTLEEKQANTMRMLTKFHSQFSRMMSISGARVPDLNSVLQRSQDEVKARVAQFAAGNK